MINNNFFSSRNIMIDSYKLSSFVKYVVNYNITKNKRFFETMSKNLLNNEFLSNVIKYLKNLSSHNIAVFEKQMNC